MKKKKWVALGASFLLLFLTGICYKFNFLYVRQGIQELKSSETFLSYVLNARPRVPVLMYHSVNENPVGIAQLSVKTQDFENQIKYIAQHGYTPLTFDQLKNAESYKKPIMITFDDGYQDNYTKAYPILKKYRCRATIFIVAKYINAPGYLSEHEMRQMSDWVSFQSHTVSHHPLIEFGAKDLKRECFAPKEAISKITKKPVTAISYPNGAYNKLVLKVAPQYYRYGVTTKYGYYYPTKGSMNYQIKRIAISRNTPLSQFIRII
ncbi:MAG: polysaccharide deacetylase family protein [Oscillospiraceae bacterium]|nr:polysaccharide deacetylase family protein [Oscillospiraceae bacterium]